MSTTDDKGHFCRGCKDIDLTKIEVRRARAEDRDQLSALLYVNGMNCASIPEEEFTVAVGNGELLACVRLEDHQGSVVVRPIVVAGPYHRQGLGRHLLKQVLPHDRPTILVARGAAFSFYATMGFRKTGWEKVPTHQLQECSGCSDRSTCSPEPMILARKPYSGGCLR